MNTFKTLALAFIAVATLSACSSDPSAPPVNTPTTLGALSCDGVRTWDFGASDVLSNTTSLISESQPISGLGTTRFPCTVLWEFSASENCSLAFSYEQYLLTFNGDDVIREIGTSGSNLIIVGNDDTRLTGTPANVSATDLANLPDCTL